MLIRGSMIQRVSQIGGVTVNSMTNSRYDYINAKTVQFPLFIIVNDKLWSYESYDDRKGKVLYYSSMIDFR